MTHSPKQAAALRALDFIQPGMRLGLGTGSTAALFVAALAQRVAEGLRITGVPPSEVTRLQAERLNIALAKLDAAPEIDLAMACETALMADFAAWPKSANVSLILMVNFP